MCATLSPSLCRLVLKRYLSTFNVEVDEAVDGDEAIQKVLENGEYAIIWMDVSAAVYCSSIVLKHCECISGVRVGLLYLQQSCCPSKHRLRLHKHPAALCSVLIGCNHHVV